MKITNDEVLEILSEVSRVPQSELQTDTRLIQDLDLDSVLTLELVMTLEDKLETEIPALEAAKLVTVGDVLEFVQSQQAAS